MPTLFGVFHLSLVPRPIYHPYYRNDGAHEMQREGAASLLCTTSDFKVGLRTSSRGFDYLGESVKVVKGYDNDWSIAVTPQLNWLINVNLCLYLWRRRS